MHLNSIKAALIGAWASAVCTAGIAGNFRSISAWTFLTGLAVIPPLVMMWQWNHPQPTMSESIQEALR